MKRVLLVGVGCIALVGCSQREPRGYASADNAMVSDSAPAEMAAGRAPGIDVTAAPGVAFTYREAYRLPSARIAAVQEGDAKACEALGVARCRITGMRYRLLGENNIEGELAFKLAPELARGFTRDATAAVEHADGTLVDAEITGTDTQPVTARADVEHARAADEVRRIDAALAHARSAAERVQLQMQRTEAVSRIAAANDTTADARASLASTPVTFRYESGPAVRGFDTSAPFTSAINTGIASIETTLAIVLALLAIFGPPALVVGLVVWAAFAIRRRRRVNVAATAAD